MSMVMIGSKMLNDDVFGGDGTEGRGVDTRSARRMMSRRLSWLRGRCSSRRRTLLLGLMASADSAAVAAIIATPAATTTPEAAAA